MKWNIPGMLVVQICIYHYRLFDCFIYQCFIYKNLLYNDAVALAVVFRRREMGKAQYICKYLPMCIGRYTQQIFGASMVKSPTFSFHCCKNQLSELSKTIIMRMTAFDVSSSRRHWLGLCCRNMFKCKQRERKLRCTSTVRQIGV